VEVEPAPVYIPVPRAKATPSCPYVKVSPREAQVALLEDQLEGLELELEGTPDLARRYTLRVKLAGLTAEITRLRTRRDLPLSAVYRG
jgi:hypothetical protein